MIQIVRVEQAVGQALAHDITEIRPGEFKGPAFKKGYVVKQNDINKLIKLGKNHLYIIKGETDLLHEDEAAEALATALCGDGVYWKDQPREGKICLLAEREGLFKVNVDALNRFNEFGEVMCATKHTYSVVKKDDQVGATRAIPLLIGRSMIDDAVRTAKDCGGILTTLPMRSVKAGVLITGNEVYDGHIEDKFESIIRKKVEALNGTIMDVVFLPDDDERIAEAAHKLIEHGADILITTGGMSVDPDDRTRFGLQKAGAEGLLYGAAVLPGAMFMIAHLKNVPVLGIPACGLFAAATVFDLIYPRVLAGETITRKDIARLGHGGMCLKCKICNFPNCSFGKSN